MLHLISTSSNYILLVLCAIYAFSSFTVYLPSKDQTQVRRMNHQENFVFIFQIICFAVLLFQLRDYRVGLLCLGQLLYFKLLIAIYRRFYPDSSRILMNHTCFLLAIGFVMLARLSFEKAIKQFIIVLVCSVVCLFIPFLMEKAYWLVKLKWFYGIAGLLMLSTVFVIGTTHNGSTNWISIGPVALQPSEFVKIVFIFFIAAVMARKPQKKFMALLILFGAAHVLILVMERDLGGALLYFLMFVFLIYVASGNLFYLIGGFLGGGLASVVSYHLFSHVRTRFQAWLDPWSVIESKGYQITQSLFAIGTGSWFGMGLTQGRPTDIPVVDSDFVFSAIAEEFGMLFALCIVIVYLAIFVHFIMIAMDVDGRFYKLIAYGSAICFILQVFFSIGGVTKFIPSTGVTLPLISYGGSSVCSVLIIIAIMQGIFMIAYDNSGEEEMDHEPAYTEEDDFIQF